MHLFLHLIHEILIANSARSICAVWRNLEIKKGYMYKAKESHL